MCQSLCEYMGAMWCYTKLRLGEICNDKNSGVCFCYFVKE